MVDTVRRNPYSIRLILLFIVKDFISVTGRRLRNRLPEIEQIRQLVFRQRSSKGRKLLHSQLHLQQRLTQSRRTMTAVDCKYADITNHNRLFETPFSAAD